MSTILFELNDGIAVLSLNRQDKANSFNREMALELQAKLDECASNNDVRCVVITGNGKAFCAGQDLSEAIDPSGPGLERILGEHYNPIVRKLRNLQKPVLAAVNGVAAGAGASLALCCDIIVAAESASFIQAFSKIGLIPDTAATFYLPRLIGWQKATALMMLADKVTAKEAEDMGMIYKTLPDADFMQEAMKIARQLAQMPTRALAYIKEALQLSATSTLDQQLDHEDRLQQAASKTADFAEGVDAFLQKRKPLFKGL